jgi:gluconolactonase
MRPFTIATVCLLIAVPAMAGVKPKPTGESIVSADAKLELLYTRTAKIHYGLTEGPAVAPDGSIYFSDIPFGTDNGMIMRFDPQTMQTTVFLNDSLKSNGLLFDSEGFLLACQGSDYGGRQVARYDVETGIFDTVANRYMGRRFNAPNDLCLDTQGRIYFSDPRYLGDEPRELKYRAVYRIDTDGTVIEITHDVSKPNGVSLSPDEKTLYVANHDNGTDKIDPTKKPPKHGIMRVYAFPLGQDGKVNGPRRTLVDFGDEAGCDGMTVDAQGNIYLTVRSAKRPGVMVINPQGDEVAFIPTGPPNQKADSAEGLPSNVEFGLGKEINVLYITVDKSLFRIPLKVKGYHRQFAKP